MTNEQIQEAVNIYAEAMSQNEMMMSLLNPDLQDNPNVFLQSNYDKDSFQDSLFRAASKNNALLRKKEEAEVRGESDIQESLYQPPKVEPLKNESEDELKKALKEDISNLEDFYRKYENDNSDLISEGEKFLKEKSIKEDKEDDNGIKNRKLWLKSFKAINSSVSNKEISKEHKFTINTDVFTHGRTLPVPTQENKMFNEVVRKYNDDLDLKKDKPEMALLKQDKKIEEKVVEEFEQQKQESLLSQQQSEKDRKLGEFLNKKSEVIAEDDVLEKNEDKEVIEKHNDIVKKDNFDEIPIVNNGMSFEELLEEELKKQGEVKDHDTDSNKPKKQFLKKNQGTKVTNRFQKKQENNQQKRPLNQFNTEKSMRPKLISDDEDNGLNKDKEEEEKPLSIKSNNNDASFKEESRYSDLKTKTNYPDTNKLMEEFQDLFKLGKQQINQVETINPPDGLKKTFYHSERIDESITEFKDIEEQNKVESQRQEDERDKERNKAVAYVKQFNPITTQDIKEDTYKDIFKEERHEIEKDNKEPSIDDNKKLAELIYEDDQPKTQKKAVNELLAVNQKREINKIKKKLIEENEREMQEFREIMEEKFRERLEELDDEILKYRTKNNKFKGERHRIDELRMNLDKEKDSFKAMKEAELKKLEELKENELKKIKREKQIALRNRKAMENKPNRREREEIEKLKKEIDRLNIEFQKKEIKLKSRVERQKAQILELKKRINTLETEKETKSDHISEQSIELKSEKKSINKRKSVSKSRSRTPNKRYSIIDRSVSRSKSPIAEPKEERKSVKKKQHITGSIFPLHKRQSLTVLTQFKESILNSQPMDKSLRLKIREQVYKYDMNKYYKRFKSDNKKALKLVKKSVLEDGNIQSTFEDGSTEIVFQNNSKRRTFPDGYRIVLFNNKDVKQTLPDSTLIYYYEEHGTTQITFPDKSIEIFRFNEGHVEFHYKDGHKEIKFPNGNEKYIYPDEEEITIFNNQSIQSVNKKKVKIIDELDNRVIYFPNGEKLFIDSNGDVSAEQESNIE